MSYNNGIEKVEKKFTIYKIRDYNTLIALLKEHHLPILKINTSTGNVNDNEEYTVTSEGEECRLKFVDYLLKKEQQKMEEAITKIGIKD